MDVHVSLYICNHFYSAVNSGPLACQFLSHCPTSASRKNGSLNDADTDCQGQNKLMRGLNLHIGPRVIL